MATKKARRKGRASDNGTPPHDDQSFAEWATDRELERLEREADRRKRVRQLPGDEFILDEPDLKAIWGSGSKILWAPGEPFMITAKPGAGKTTVGGQLLYHRIGVRKGPLLGLPVEPLADGEQALYLAMDRPPQIARSLKRGMNEDDRYALHDRLVVWRGPLPFILREDDPKELAEWVVTEFPNVRDVYIDSLKDVAVGLAKDEVGALVNMAAQELCIHGLEIVELHHHRKAGKDGGGSVSLDDVYGSAWLTAGAGSVIYLQGEAGATHVKLRHLKPPNDAVGPLNLVHDHAAGTTSVHHLETDVLAYVIGRGREGASVAEVALVCFGGTEKKDTQKANRELKKLSDSLERVPGKRGGKGGGEVAPRWRAKAS